MSRIFQFYLVSLLLVLAIALSGCSENPQRDSGKADQRKNQKTEQQVQAEDSEPSEEDDALAEQEGADVTVEGTELPAQERAAVGEPIVWQADMETGDLSQWRIAAKKGAGTEVDSGKCRRTTEGVSDEQAHSGIYSMKMVIDSRRTAGCRQFRKQEAASGQTFYYSAWFYIPERVQVGVFWNIFQFKSNLNGKSGLFWKLEIRNNEAGDMVIVPVWKGPIPGPHAGDGVRNRLYYQTKAIVPVGEWFHLEVYLEQSEEFDGQIIVWQDGIELLNERNVRTKYPGGIQNWSVNNYGHGLTPNPTVLYIDDVVVSTERIGPTQENDS